MLLLVNSFTVHLNDYTYITENTEILILRFLTVKGAAKLIDNGQATRRVPSDFDSNIAKR